MPPAYSYKRNCRASQLTGTDWAPLMNQSGAVLATGDTVVRKTLWFLPSGASCFHPLFHWIHLHIWSHRANLCQRRWLASYMPRQCRLSIKPSLVLRFNITFIHLELFPWNRTLSKILFIRPVFPGLTRCVHLSNARISDILPWPKKRKKKWIMCLILCELPHIPPLGVLQHLHIDGQMFLMYTVKRWIV